jgi:hypothetical protein
MAAAYTPKATSALPDIATTTLRVRTVDGASGIGRTPSNMPSSSSAAVPMRQLRKMVTLVVSWPMSAGRPNASGKLSA